VGARAVLLSWRASVGSAGRYAGDTKANANDSQ